MKILTISVTLTPGSLFTHEAAQSLVFMCKSDNIVITPRHVLSARISTEQPRPLNGRNCQNLVASNEPHSRGITSVKLLYRLPRAKCPTQLHTKLASRLCSHSNPLVPDFPLVFTPRREHEGSIRKPRGLLATSFLYIFSFFFHFSTFYHYPFLLFFMFFVSSLFSFFNSSLLHFSVVIFFHVFIFS